MFNNKGNNKDKKDYGVNTKAVQFKNKNGIDPSTLIVGYWNDMLKLKIHPALPKDKQTEESVYDYEHSLNTALTLDKILSLYEQTAKIQKAIEEEKHYRVGVKIGQTSAVIISTGVKETGEVRPYIGIYKDIDADTEQANQGIRYEFNKTETLEDYDPETGKTEEKVQIPSEFLLFRAVLRSSLEHLTNAAVHSMRTVQNYYNTKQMDTIMSIASKLGIETTGGKTGFGNTGSSSMFNLGSTQQSTNFQAPADAPIVDGSLDQQLPF